MTLPRPAMLYDLRKRVVAYLSKRHCDLLEQIKAPFPSGDASLNHLMSIARFEMQAEAELLEVMIEEQVAFLEAAAARPKTEAA
jgi:hypothetical protein